MYAYSNPLFYWDPDGHLTVEQEEQYAKDGYPAVVQNSQRRRAEGGDYPVWQAETSAFVEDMAKAVGEKITEAVDGAKEFVKESKIKIQNRREFENTHPKYARMLQYYGENLKRLPKDKLNNDPEFINAVYDYLQQHPEKINRLIGIPSKKSTISLTDAITSTLKRGIDSVNIFDTDPSLSRRDRFKRLVNLEAVVYATGKTISGGVLPKNIQKNEKYLFRGTVEGYPGRYGDVSPTSTDPAVATHFAVQAESMYGGKGVVYIIPESSVSGKILPPQYNALPYEYEVPLAIRPREIPDVSKTILTSTQSRELLKQNGVNVPSTINDNRKLTETLRNKPPMTPEQINKFVNGAK